jgi:hypothetical protein
MLVSWAPGYDWEVRLWESTSIDRSEGGITIQVRTPYPNDPRLT